MTVWCAGLDETGSAGSQLRTRSARSQLRTRSARSQPGRTSLIQTCTPNGQLYRVTYARCRTDTINFPDDGHMAARNM